VKIIPNFNYKILSSIKITDNNGNVSPDVFHIQDISFETNYNTGFSPSETGKLRLKTTRKNRNFLLDIRGDKLREINISYGELITSLYDCLITEINVNEYGYIELYIISDYYQVEEDIKLLRKLKLDAINEISNK